MDGRNSGDERSATLAGKTNENIENALYEEKDNHEGRLLTVEDPHDITESELPGDPPPIADPSPSPSPNGGWGWVVVAACAVGHFLIVGIAQVFGVFYVVLLEKFGGSAQATAWVHALYNTVRMVTGPLVSRLCDRFTIRKVIIVGAIIQGIGCIVSAFATSLVYLYFSYGVLNGFGGGLIFTPMFIAISQYFEKNKGKAMALATLGSSLGSVTLAPLATLLLQEYSWTGAMLVVGGLMFHNIAVGMVMRPLPKPPKSLQPKADEDVKDMELLENRKHSGISDNSGCFSKLRKSCKRTEGFTLLRNPTYLLYCVTVVGMPFIAQLSFLMIPPLARERGLTDSQAAWIISVMGISDMTGRFAHGFLFDLKCVLGRRRAMFCILGIAVAGVNAAFGVVTSFSGFLVVAVGWGVFESGFHGQRVTIQSEFVPASQISKTVGNMMFCQGVGNLLAPITGGLLVDVFGSYRVPFYYGSIVTMSSSSLFLMDFIFGAKLAGSCSKQL